VAESEEGELRELRAEVRQLKEQNLDLEVELSMLREARAFLERGTTVLAQRIQTSVLPLTLDVPGFDVVARMQPAEIVGGDYYDVRRVDDGMWIAIGDVTGHGVTAGLIALFAHASLAALGGTMPSATPAAVVRELNDLLVDGLDRMRVSEHMTFALLRIHDDGRLVWAGAHEDLLIVRSGTGKCETLGGPGTWLGRFREAREHIVDTEARLEAGDVLCLFTDGIIEARDAERRQLGVERLAEILESSCREPGSTAERICERIFSAVAAHEPEPFDDRTVIIARRA
jgi:sigma-B regulation protein RsbU (phosphoserine phosphatase)